MSKKDEAHSKEDDGLLARMKNDVVAVIRMNLGNPDMKAAMKLIGEQARLIWQKCKGGELEIVELSVQEVEKAYAKSCDFINSLLDTLHRTKPYIKAALARGGTDSGSVPFSQWQGKDQGVAVFSLVSALGVLFMGACNVFANLVGSGNPVFIEQPILAYFLSALLPASSVALKFVSEVFTGERTRRLYIQSMYVLTVFAILAWTVLFALNFHGISGGIDLDSFEETDYTASAFVWTQLLSELFVGFVLCHVAADTYARYTRDAFIRNPEYARLQDEVKTYQPEHERIRTERNARRSLLVELTASRESFSNEMIALYQSLRRRFDESSPTGS